MSYRLMTMKARIQMRADAYAAGFVEGSDRGYASGFEDGLKHAENHCFELPDIEPELSQPPVRPDAEAERLRGRMLDLDPYEPIQREDTP